MKIRTIRVLLLSMSILLIPTHRLAASVPFDGVWWEAVSKDRRTFFISGYLDCLLFDVGYTQSKCNCSKYIMEPMITNYYKTKPAELNSEVITIFLKLCAQELPVTEPSAGEIYSGKHGNLDGDFWYGRTPDEQLGFIEGYLECQKKYNKPVAIFSQNTEWYVNQISQWYGLDPNDRNHVNDQLFTVEKRYIVAIADVLFAINQSGNASTAKVETLIKLEPKAVEKIK